VTENLENFRFLGGSKALFRPYLVGIFLILGPVVFLFIFNNYYLIMD